MMNLLRRCFGSKLPEAPLSPLEDRTLGRLTWDEDCEGWIGNVSLGDALLRLYVGGGSAHGYPPEALLDLLRQPYEDFERLSADALTYLRTNMNFNAWQMSPGTLKLEGLETFGHYLKDHTYCVTFSDHDGSIWRVDFCGEVPVGCGVDD